MRNSKARKIEVTETLVGVIDENLRVLVSFLVVDRHLAIDRLVKVVYRVCDENVHVHVLLLLFGHF